MTELIPLLSVVIGLLVAARGWWEHAQAEKRRALLDYRTKQLQDLYGPLQLQRRRSEALRTRLPRDPPGGRWRLVHHIGAIKDAKDKQVYATYSREVIQTTERILKCGEEVVDLLIRGGGLLEYPSGKAYELYIEHFERLQMSWDAGVSQPPDDSRPFPGGTAGEGLERCDQIPDARDIDIDCAIRLDTLAIQNELIHLRKADGGFGLVTALTHPLTLAVAFTLLLGVGIVELLHGESEPAHVVVSGRDGVRCGELTTSESGDVLIDGQAIDDVTYLVEVPTC